MYVLQYIHQARDQTAVFAISSLASSSSFPHPVELVLEQTQERIHFQFPATLNCGTNSVLICLRQTGVHGNNTC
ncbi:hypothetical protein BaRGS_00033128, partial [Batillaria attramentaria]